MKENIIINKQVWYVWLKCQTDIPFRLMSNECLCYDTYPDSLVLCVCISVYWCLQLDLFLLLALVLNPGVLWICQNKLSPCSYFYAEFRTGPLRMRLSGNTSLRPDLLLECLFGSCPKTWGAPGVSLWLVQLKNPVCFTVADAGNESWRGNGRTECGPGR